jgi:hypothetical protein
VSDLDGFESEDSSFETLQASGKKKINAGFPAENVIPAFEPSSKLRKEKWEVKLRTRLDLRVALHTMAVRSLSEATSFWTVTWRRSI